MPVTSVAAYAGGRAARATDRIDREHLVLLAGLAAAGVALWFAAARRTTGGVKAPAFDETAPAFAPPPGAPVLGPDQHIGGVTFTPHRYPARCGGEISALIHHGHAVLRIPAMTGADWMTRPPSEEQL